MHFNNFLLPKHLLQNVVLEEQRKAKRSFYQNEMYDTNLDFWTQRGLCGKYQILTMESVAVLPHKSKL
jgi:hypothetical protein